MAAPLVMYGSRNNSYASFPSDVDTAVPFVVDEGRTVFIQGDLNIGTAIAPVALDAVLLLVREGGRLIIAGDLTVYRDVAGTVPLVAVSDAGGVLEVHGATTLSDVGGGASAAAHGVEALFGAKVKFVGNVSVTSECATLASCVTAHNGSQIEFASDLDIVALPGADISYALNVNDESKIGITGDLSVASDGLGNNIIGLVIASRCSELTIGGTLTIDTDVNICTSPGLGAQSSSTIIVEGDVTLDLDAMTNQAVIIDDESHIHFRGGNVTIASNAAQVFLVQGGSKFTCDDAIDFASMGAGAADGSVMSILEGSVVRLEQVLFNGGADMDCGAFASFLVADGSQLHCDDSGGASDALNDSNNAVCTGLMLTHHSTAYLPAWGGGAGIAAVGAGAGLDQQVGAVGAGPWAGAAEMVDPAQLCLASLVA
jgi:hypothetical protein